jgi:hypothetical protein
MSASTAPAAEPPRNPSITQKATIPRNARIAIQQLSRNPLISGSGMS